MKLLHFKGLCFLLAVFAANLLLAGCYTDHDHDRHYDRDHHEDHDHHGGDYDHRDGR